MISRFIILLLVALIFILVVFIFNILPRALKSDNSAETMVLQVGGQSIVAEVASSPMARIRGLSGHPPLEDGHGMLFIFDVPSIQGFWMKDMNFAIDIIWIENGSVAGVVPNARPDDRAIRPVYYSPVPVQYVLEVPAGTAARFGIVPGTPIEINSKS